MKLFNNSNPTFHGPARNNENTYEYFERSARKDVLIVKEKLEALFQSYPDEHKFELKSRFKNTFYDSYYELFLFHLFRKLKFEVEIHPEIDGSGYTPDFLISNRNGQIFVEAKCVYGISNEQRSLEKMKAEFFDNINKLSLKGYFLDIQELKLKSGKQPSTVGLKKQLDSEISRLNHENVLDSWKAEWKKGIPVIEYSDDDFYIKVGVIPGIRDKTPFSTIGAYPIEFFSGSGENEIRKAIDGKTRKFRSLDNPLIVCVNAINKQTNSKLDAQSVVWGTLGHEISNYNGLFYRNGKSVNQDLSGVIISQAYPFNMPNSDLWFFKNPFGFNDVDFHQFKLGYQYVEDFRIKEKESTKDLSEILKMNPNWLNKNFGHEGIK